MLPPALIVPTLDAIAVDAALVDGLPLQVVAALMSRCAAVQSALAAAQLAGVTDGSAPHDDAPTPEADRMLLPAEAAVLLRRQVRWIYRNADRLPFVKHLPALAVVL